jgi:protein-S-isoprenylcysteine O-methyltransferase Ste14
MTEARDNPGVVAPPPLIVLGGLVLGFLLEWLLPLHLLDPLLSLWTRRLLGGVIIAGGLALGAAAWLQFRQVGTNTNPSQPSLSIAAFGPFRYVRNPMYCGLLLMIGGIGVAFASAWTLLMLVPIALTLHYGVVLREERYLETKFGEDYRRYKAEVPRWGIW